MSGQMVLALISGLLGTAIVTVMRLLGMWSLRAANRRRSVRDYAIHFAYGAGWGMYLPLLINWGVRDPWALAGIFMLTAWVVTLLLRASKLDPWLWRDGSIGTDFAHHVAWGGFVTFLYYGMSLYLVSRLGG